MTIGDKTMLELENSKNNELEENKQACMYKILGWIHFTKEGELESLLTDSKFRALWLRTCQLFELFQDTKKATCSLSNIQAFEFLVKRDYPEVYEKVTESAAKVIEDIKLRIDSKLSPQGYIEDINIGPIELLKRVQTLDFNNTAELEADIILLFQGDKAQGYLPYFNQYILDEFTNEKTIKKFLMSSGKGNYQLRRDIIKYIKPINILLLISRLSDGRDVLNPSTSLVFSIVKDFILSNTTTSSTPEELRLEELICKVASFMEDNDEIKNFIVNRYPGNYIDILPKSHGYEQLPNDESLAERK